MTLARRVAVVALVVLLPAVAACARRPLFQGQVLDPPRPPLDFTLTDQFDHPVQLSGLHGKVVVLMFLFTACPDVCPLTAGKIHEVTDLLGAHRDRVAFLAVTVDPDRDTVPVVAARPAAAQPVDSAPLSPFEEPLTNPTPSAETPAPLPLGSAAALLGILLLGLGAARQPATAARMLLVLLLVIAAAETAIHSVHHLDSPQGSASCRVLTVTQQLHGEAVPELPSGAPLVEFSSYTVVAISHDTAQSVRRPDEGRAPPLPLA